MPLSSLKKPVGLQQTNIYDPINKRSLVLESNLALPVNLQDQHTEIVDYHMFIHISDFSLSNDTYIDSTSIIVTAGHSIEVDHLINLYENGTFYQGTAISVNGNEIEVDSPIDYPFTTSANGVCGLKNLTVDGQSMTQIAYIDPPFGIEWDVVRILFHIQSTSDMDDSKFGGIPALQRGIVLRHKRNGSMLNICNVKKNGDFAIRAYEIEYADKAPAGQYGFRCRRTFGGQDKNGVTIRLSSIDPLITDALQILIQDDLSTLTNFEAVIQGHVVTD